MGNIFLKRTPLPITEDDQTAAKRAFDAHGIEGLVSHLKAAVSEWKNTEVDIGFIGESGRGKSTFINAIRGLTADDEGAAAVGCIETTKKPRPYPHPMNPLLKLWDLPGVGTTTFPREEYLEAIQIDKYDCFVILTATRFVGNDAWLATEIAQRHKMIYLVRTKFQNDVANDKDAHPITHDPKTLLRRVRNDLAERLYELQCNAPIYIIDSHHRNLYDFESLIQAITKELPSKNKQKAAILTLNTFSKKMVSKKIQELNNAAWKTALLAINQSETMFEHGVPRVPNPTALLTEVKEYFKVMGLQDESLLEMAKATNVDFQKLRDKVDAHFPAVWLSSEEMLLAAWRNATPAFELRSIYHYFRVLMMIPYVQSRFYAYKTQLSASWWALTSIGQAVLEVVTLVFDESWTEREPPQE